MSDIGRSRSSVCRFSEDEAYLNTLAEQMPQMTRIFEILDSGSTPNFLDIIGGISEMVAFYTDHDQNSAADKILSEKMSGKKCRFCS